MLKGLKKYWAPLTILILSWWSIKPLFHSGFFSMHDDTQVARVYEMAKALRDLQFPVRWVADLGYGFGYPLFNFYAPLPYYLGGFFNLVGFDALTATKLMFLFGILLSGIFMYFLAKEFFGKIGGILAAIFYVYAPYHAVNIYVRGAVDEFWAMAFLPLMAWGFYKVTKYSMEKTILTMGSKLKTQNSKLQVKSQNELWNWTIVGTLGFSGVILSHNLTAMMTIPFLLIGLIWYWATKVFGREKSWKIKLRLASYALVPILLSLGLSAFYWLPALWEMRFTNVSSQIGGGADFRDHFLCLNQFWNSPWGFGGSAPGCVSDGMSFQLGKLQLILAAIIVPLALFRRKPLGEVLWRGLQNKRFAILFSLFFLLLSMFMATQYSQFIWERIKPMAFIQYPWRFLIFGSFFSSLLAASIVLFFQNRILRFIIFVLFVAMLLPYRIKYFNPQQYLSLKVQDYTNEETLKWKTSKTSDEFLPQGFISPKNQNDIVKEKIVIFDKTAKINDLRLKSNLYTFRTTVDYPTLIGVRLAYFPGWTVFVDGREKFLMVQRGQLFFSVPKGPHFVEVIFKNTLIRSLGNALSLISLAIIIGGIFYGRKKIKS